MNEIVLPPELLGAVDTTRPMVIKLPDGRVLGTVGPVFSTEQIAELKAKTKEDRPWYSGDQLQARLKALDAEWARTGGFDQDYMRTFLVSLSESDPVVYGPTR